MSSSILPPSVHTGRFLPGPAREKIRQHPPQVLVGPGHLVGDGLAGNDHDLRHFVVGQASETDQLEDLPWYAVLSKNMIPNMEAAVLKSATFDALVLTARAGLACRIFKGRTGQYPETLDVLVGSLLSHVPIDPFTGDPLVYRREGDGFVVYSLGSNLRDNGGRGTWEITQMVMDKDDDWAWREAQ